VATLVARRAPRAELFEALVTEVGRLMPAADAALARFEGDGTLTMIGRWPSRVTSYEGASGTLVDMIRDWGWRSSVGAPVTVDASVWGFTAVGSTTDQHLPEGTDGRLAAFTELLANAIANAQGRQELEHLAAEQAALRRVATLVARDSSPAEVFAAVAEELGLLLRVDETRMLRFEPDGSGTFVATWGDTGESAIPLGTRMSLEGENVPGQVLRTGRPARIDDYTNATGDFAAFVRARGTRSAVGSPIAVQGKLWGVMVAASLDAEPLPVGTEGRMAQFTELVSTAIANGQARSELRLLVDEQAALRRVATLVARQPSPREALGTVAKEVGTLLGVDGCAILRFESDAAATVVAGWGQPDVAGYVDRRLPVDGDNPVAYVVATMRPARQEDWSQAKGVLAEISREVGVTCSVATPIVVEGRLWGVIVVVTLGPSPMPADTETRTGQFTDLVATAIGNVETRSELNESRARIVRTADETRRRFERDLHDGVQQRLVSLALDLRGVEAMLPRQLEEPREQLSQAAQRLGDALRDVRELSRGLHPAVLSEGGLAPALRALARRSAIPVELELDVGGRLREPIEVAAYFVVSEALANATKHAQASLVETRAAVSDGALDVTIRDDGIGGADPARGSGLIGLTDRVEALGGTIAIASPPGEGTRLLVKLPL
jgi:signal transduction histidine kinase